MPQQVEAEGALFRSELQITFRLRPRKVTLYMTNIRNSIKLRTYFLFRVNSRYSIGGCVFGHGYEVNVKKNGRFCSIKGSVDIPIIK